MVRRVDSNKSKAPATTGVQSTTKVQGAQVGTVQQVAKAEGNAPAGRVRKPTRPMTLEERQHLLALLDEEADKMFADASSTKKHKVAAAVKMALEASDLEVEDVAATGTKVVLRPKRI